MNRSHAYGLIVITAVFLLISIAGAAALVSVSHMGYHPDGHKSMTVYTSATSGTYKILSGTTIVDAGVLTVPEDLAGNPVKCQGQMSCLVGDFSSFNQPGTYVIEATTGGNAEQSRSFTIGAGVYRDNAWVFEDYFEAHRMTGSSFHADMNTFTDPQLTVIADGSFIMESQQAARTLIRLGNAYWRNPEMASAEMVQNMISYVDYLAELQDAKIQTRTDGVGFRIEEWMAVQRAFIPGPTDKTSLTIYAGPEGSEQPVMTVPLRSLCYGPDAPADAASCLEFAQDYYKCQADEPCIEMVYQGKTGTRVPGESDGLGVDMGWYYEWSCYFDVDLDNGVYNDHINPCLIYNNTETLHYTAMTLLAYTKSIPIIEEYDPAKAADILDRAKRTQAYIKSTYAIPAADQNDGDVIDSDAGYYGAANFMLYDLTGDVKYLQEAHGVKDKVLRRALPNAVNGQEFYWQEYIAHKDTIVESGLSYPVGGFPGSAPEDFFRGKVYVSYYNGAELKAASKTGERVYQEFRDTSFSNSRAMLAMSIIASKSLDLVPDTPGFTSELGDAQIAWVTGNNAVDWDSASSSNDLRSTSFIFGIGEHPTQFHSRYLQDTGYSDATGGKLAGMRGTGYKFRTDAGAYEWLDGNSSILGQEFGAQGNKLGGELETPQMVVRTFLNGLPHIPGWINGAFDIRDDPAEIDDIYNYVDDRRVYEYTESANDIVATAIEAFAYADAHYNDVEPLALPFGDWIPINVTPPNTTNQTNGTATLNIASVPGLAYVYVDGILRGGTPTSGYLPLTVGPGNRSLMLEKTGYANVTQAISLVSGENKSITVPLTQMNTTNLTVNGTITVTTSPSGANVSIDGKNRGLSPVMLSLAPGIHTVLLSKTGYLDTATNFTVASGETRTITYALDDGSAPQVVGTPMISNITGQRMLETEVAVFTVQYDRATPVKWYVDGMLKATDADDGDHRSSFSWHPMITYAGNKVKTAEVKAVANRNVTTAFNIDVIDVINPFWGDKVGSSNDVFVYTNDQVAEYDSVSVVLQDASGQRTVPLVNGWSDDIETKWNALVENLAAGNTYITAVIVIKNGTGAKQYPIDGVLAHNRPGSSGGSGGGGGSQYQPLHTEEVGDSDSPPELVYAVFSKDTILKNGSVVLAVDARDDEEVISVVAVMADPNGRRIDVPLTLTEGSGGYGTWTAQMDGLSAGQHTLSRIIITDDFGHVTTAEVGNRAVYVLGDTVLSGESLLLVYAILTESSVDPGQPVTVKLDARDFNGIRAVSAVLKSPKQEIPVELELAGGDNRYGTWEGSVTPIESDTTYALYTVTLDNGNETKTQRVYGQKVYVSYVVPVETVSDTQDNERDFRQIVRNPITPLIIGLVGMGIAMLIVSSMTFLKTEK